MNLHLPRSFKQLIGDAVVRRDEIGESPCRVYHFERGRDLFFLKHSAPLLAGTTYSVRREASVMVWASRSLNVPEVVLSASDERGEYLISRAVPGQPLSAYLHDSEMMVQTFQAALKAVQSVPIQDCPFDNSIQVRLKELKHLMTRGIIDQNFDLSAWPGLKTADDLVRHLEMNRPAEDLVFSHGDLGDSNIFVHGDELHFIDWGRGGTADRWLDIAFAHRNLREDVSVQVADAFIGKLDLPDEPEKRLYFEQLDELF